MIRCLHHSSAFTAPSFLIPPSLPALPPACPPFTSRLSAPTLPLQLQAITEVAAEQMAGRQMWQQAWGEAVIIQLQGHLIDYMLFVELINTHSHLYKHISTEAHYKFKLQRPDTTPPLNATSELEAVSSARVLIQVKTQF